MSKKTTSKKTTTKKTTGGTVTSKTPEKSQIGKVIDIEGIGPAYAKDLEKVGIKTTEDLRKASLVELVENTGISPKLLFKWICQADLFRLKCVAEEYANLLFEMEIETVKEVSKQNPAELHK